MNNKLKRCQDYFKLSHKTFKASRLEALEVVDMYHNRQFTSSQLSTLRERGQPAETFNVIKMYVRMLNGYFSTVVNSILVNAVGINDSKQAALGQDIVNHTLRHNNFKVIKTKLQKDLLCTGLCCYRVASQDKGKKDQFGTPEKQIVLEHVPWEEIYIDPLSRKEDYSDARYVHRWKWVDEETLIDTYGKAKVATLMQNQNTEDIKGYDLTQKLNGEFVGRYKTYDMYLVIETQYKDKDKIRSVIWSGDTLLEESELTELKDFTLKPFVLEYSDKAEHYGLMRELTETQKAINQAIIQIQLLVNTNKVFVEEGAVDDFTEFEKKFARVNAIMQVNNLAGIKVDNLSVEVVQQYEILNNALNRCQRLLGINDSFLGMQGSSASGRSVQLQQNSAVVALRYITEAIEFIYTEVGKSILNAAKVYYKANTFLRIADKINGDRWVEMNKPFTMPNERGEQEVAYYDDVEFDSETGEANITPIMEPESQIAELDYDIEVTTSPYNDTDEIERVTLEAILAGPAGQLLAQAAPQRYFKIAGMNIQALKSRYSEEISKEFFEMAQQLGGAPVADPRAVQQMGGGNPQGNGGQDAAVGKMLSALGATNDAQAEGYNHAKQ